MNANNESEALLGHWSKHSSNRQVLVGHSLKLPLRYTDLESYNDTDIHMFQNVDFRRPPNF